MDTVLIFPGGDAPMVSAEELPAADLIVAADSGYDRAVSQGFRVDVLIGDLDSIETELIPNHVIVERFPADKDATDLELALARTMAEAPLRVVVVGGTGGRLDHELGTASLLCSPRWSDVEELDWLTARGWGHVIHRRRSLHGDVGSLVSLLPVGGDAHGVSTRGLRWELKGETLAVGATRGLSNEFASPVAEVVVDSGVVLALIPLA